MARLVVESGGERREYPISGSLVIGRLKSNPVFIDDPKLSREHCRVQFDGRSYYVQDLGSKNGSFLNGRRLEAPAMLRPGDRIKIGEVTFRFDLDSHEAAPPPAPATGPLHVAPVAKSREVEEAERRAIAVRLADPKNRETSPVEVGPSAGEQMMYWSILGVLLCAGVVVMKIVFVWAIGVVTS